MRSPSAVAPPFWVWLASALAALVGVAFSLPPFLDARAQAQAGSAGAQLTEAIARFAAAEPSSPAPLRVIAFGDSALATATLQRPEMNDYARERGLDLDYLRLWVPFCLLHQILPAMGEALAAEPDLLIIETWSVVYKLDDRSAEIHRAFQAERGVDLGGALQWVSEAPSLVLDHQAYLLDRFTGAPEEGRNAVAEARARPGLRCDPASRRRMLRGIEARSRADAPLGVDPLLRQTLDALLDRARAHGVRVVFLDIPRAQQIEALPAVQAKRAVTHELLAQYVNEGRAEVLESPGALADEDTCDYIHFTQVGRDRYLPWLVDRLAALKDGAPQ